MNEPEQTDLRCGWCSAATDPRRDGFHLVHVAFGLRQERHCFCSDACYEAFRRMYPSRVHRNCYDRHCAECDLCVKRHDDGVEAWRSLVDQWVRAEGDADP
jgi:hypothetical protein